MKDFLKYMLASMLGFVITLVIAFFLFIVMIASLISFTEKEIVEVQTNSIIKMKLDYSITDRTQKTLFPGFGPEMEIKEMLGLNDILVNIDKAARDDKIKGICMNLSIVPSDYATIGEIREALIDFKETGKFIICYSEGMTQLAYFLGSVADKFFLHPDGMLEIKGLGAEMMFLKGTLEKLDIEPQLMRAGKYKSAAEPLIMDQMSEANREQTQRYIDMVWTDVAAKISADREISQDEFNEIADKLDALNAEKALELGLVDDLLYKDQLINELKLMLDIEDGDIESVTIEKYNNVPDQDKKKLSRNKIAVVYAIGSIEGGKGDDMTIGSDRISEAIREARLDDKVKAIVMRVNSPGGSAIASEVIRREIELAGAKKPVIVSMGRLAASGGYWISCSADKIIADPTTLTGSIGVFGLIPNMKGFFNNKLGITFDYANTNENSDFPSISKPLSPYQVSKLEMEIDIIYQDFLRLVADGRQMTIEEVHELAQGRIWAAGDAVNLGLVDEIGGFNDAIQMAAELSELDDYRILELPYQKDPFDQLIDELLGKAKTSLIKSELGDKYKYYQYLKSIDEMKGIQARLPFEMDIK